MSEDRKVVIIKTQFQQKLIIKTVLTTFITLNTILIVAYLMTGAIFESSMSTQMFLQYLAALELVAMGVIYFISRKISFHIAGPVYALERSLKSMHEGDLTINLKLRKGDNFGEVSDALNETLTLYREQIRNIKQIVNEMKTENQHSLLDDLDEKLKFFKTEEDLTDTKKGEAN